MGSSITIYFPKKQPDLLKTQPWVKNLMEIHLNKQSLHLSSPNPSALEQVHNHLWSKLLNF